MKNPKNPMLPDRIGALIIRDKELLLVTGYSESFWWTPGGKIEEGETPEECLKRELFEELGINLKSMKEFFTIRDSNEALGEEQTVHYYLADYSGDIIPKEEITKTIWFSRQNFLDKAPRISKKLMNHVVPKLIEKDFL